MEGLNVVVVGAGIGGLQTALALANDGHNVRVLESAKAFEEVRIALDFVEPTFLATVLTSIRSVPASASLPIHVKSVKVGASISAKSRKKFRSATNSSTGKAMYSSKFHIMIWTPGMELHTSSCIERTWSNSWRRRQRRMPELKSG